MAKVALILACLAAAAIAEPPLPQGQYPPSSQYGTPSGPLGVSSQYGVPGRFGGGRSGQQPGQGYPSGPNGNGGFSASGYGGDGEDGNNEPANYEFKYDVEEQESGLSFGHEESRQGDVAQGKYYVLLPDGRTQTVEYVADQDGYRPTISYQGGDDQGYGSGGPNGQGGYSSGGPSSRQGGFSSGGPNGFSSGNANGYSSEGANAGYSSGAQGGYSR